MIPLLYKKPKFKGVEIFLKCFIIVSLCFDIAKTLKGNTDFLNPCLSARKKACFLHLFKP